MAVGLLCTWLIIYPLVRQQGRMLVRLEALENGVADAPIAAQPQADAKPTRPPGLSVGEIVPPFSLPDLAHRTVALEDFRGRRVLLVHWSPDCGFCEQIAGDLAKLQRDLGKRAVKLVLVSYGNGESDRRLAREHDLSCPVVLQEPSTRIEAFRTLGTPAAYLLDEKGRVAAPLALGVHEVPLLAGQAAARRRPFSQRSLENSRIERDGLKAGTPAPSFSLPDLEGASISLEQYRGRRLLLLFSDPQCGPCDALASQLGALRREHPGDRLAVLMVSRGDADENRRKAAEHGIEFPIVIQPGWRVSKEYGIFAMPVAFLVDEKGVIERNVARGPDEILALARESLGVPTALPMRLAGTDSLAI
ncbi:MAG TPA: redoxin domain-containing protein [Solirubrobacteraceae bacterium]